MQNLPKFKYILIGLTFTILAICIAGMVYRLQSPSLSDPEVSQIDYSHSIGSLGPNYDPEMGIGQSFTVRRQNLNSITIWVEGSGTETDPRPFIHFNLYQDSSKKEILFQAIYQLPSANYKGPYRFNFPKVKTFDQQTLFFDVNASNGIFRTKGILVDVYPGGTGFSGNQPIDADLAFSTTYEFDSTELLQDINKITKNSIIFIPIIFILILPGWFIMNCFKITRRIDFWSKIAVSTGISLAVIPMIFLWTNIAGIRWNKNGVILFFGLLTGFFIWQLLDRLIRNGQFEIKISGIGITLTGIIIASSLIRIFMIRDYASPLWVDSVHHGFITSLIQEQGSIILDYQPYFDTNPTAYHPGFHASLAAFQWLSNIELPPAILIFGQALNVFGVLATYLFTKTLTKSSKAGIWGAIAAGTLLPLPAYMTSWGRYTHLAGMIIFASCVYLITNLLTNSSENSNGETILNKLKDNFSLIFLAALCSTGLFLVHYRVAAFLAIWVVLFSAVKIIGSRDKKYKILSIIFVFIFGLGLGKPWILPTVDLTFIPRLPPSLGATPAIFSDFDPTVLTSGFGVLVLSLSLLGLGFAILKERSTAIIHILWVAALFTIANLASLGIVGGTFVNNLSVEISLFPIIACFFGYGIAQVDLSILRLISHPQLIKIWRVLVILLGCMLVLTGGIKLVTIINPNTALARQDDITAIQWIRNNIAPSENFFISPFEWGYGLCAGYNGGYFISSFAGNNTYPQPILYAMGSGKYTKINKEICTQSDKYLASPEDLRHYMSKLGVNYIYIGARGGIINKNHVSDASLFEIVYQNGGVWIAKVLQP